MICAKCGATLQEGFIYCSRCGQEAQIVSEINILEDDLLRELMGEDKALEKKLQMRQSRKEEKAQLKKKEEEARRRQQKKNRRFLILLLLLLLLLLSAGFGYTHYAHQHSVDYWMAKAEKEYAQKDYVSAAAYLEKVLALDAEDVDALLLGGKIATAQKEYETAIAYYEQVLSLDTENVSAYKGLIKIYDTLEERDLLLALMDGVENDEILALFEDYIIAAPAFSVESGTYSAYFSVKISAQKRTYTVYYTLDGTNPAEDGILYESPVEIDTQDEVTLMAVCVDENGYYSEVVSAVYHVVLAAPDAPVVTPGGGQFSEAKSIIVTVPEGCTVYYSWTNTTPTENDTRYTGGITMIEGNNVLSLIAVDGNGQCSEVARYNFIYYPATVEEEVSE